MSQEKVNRYKKDKANRQKIMKREKIIRRLEITIAAVVVVGLLIWFGTAVYQNSVAVAEDEYLTGLTTSSTSAE